MKRRRSALLAFLLAPTATLAALWFQTDVPSSAVSRVELGRQVYVSEGCVHCHSQYVRPVVDEGIGLGPARSPEFPRHQAPVLIGNRRQGPDLMNVGLRRTPEWHRLHLIDPRQVSRQSVMPSYAHLFAPENRERGEALIEYLDSLGHESESGVAGAATRATAALRPLIRPRNLPADQSE